MARARPPASWRASRTRPVERARAGYGAHDPIAAEDVHEFRDRLGEITAPTLVVAGADDPFYTEALFRETAAGIPGAKLVLYPGMGHPARGKQFARDVLGFLSGP